MASYGNYPSGYALKELHNRGSLMNNSTEWCVHIDPFSAMNGISRFCEYDFPWRYSKEEEIPIQEFDRRNFTYLLNEHSNIHGFKCLFAVRGFSRVRLQIGIPPISLVKEPKVFIHGNIRSTDVMNRTWPGCSWHLWERSRVWECSVEIEEVGRRPWLQEREFIFLLFSPTAVIHWNFLPCPVKNCRASHMGDWTQNYTEITVWTENLTNCKELLGSTPKVLIQQKSNRRLFLMTNGHLFELVLETLYVSS